MINKNAQICTQQQLKSLSIGDTTTGLDPSLTQNLKFTSTLNHATRLEASQKSSTINFYNESPRQSPAQSQQKTRSMHWQDGDKVEPAVLVNPASSMDAIPAANLRDLTNDSSLQQVSVVNYDHATLKAMERSAASLGFPGAPGGGHSSNGSSTMGQMLRKSYDEDRAFQDKLNYAKHRSPPKGGAKGNLIGADMVGPSKTKASDIKAAASRGVNNKGGSVSGAEKGEALSVALLGGHKASVVSQ